jgi:tetratricopeptide (TPR) repeat protein
MKHRIAAKTIAILFLGLYTAFISTAGAGTLFNQANENMGKGKYGEAAKLYEKLTEQSGYSADVLFNLAVSYEHSGQTGKAILNYERALRLAPSDSDIKGNLHLLRKKNGLFPRELSWSEKFFQLLNLDQWLLSGLVFLILFTLLQLASLRFTFSPLIKRVFSVGCLFLIALTAAGAVYEYPVYHSWVVTTEGSHLLLSPFDSSKSNGSIQVGRLVFPEKKHNKFTYIKDDKGRRGWIHLQDAEPVIPMNKQDYFGQSGYL